MSYRRAALLRLALAGTLGCGAGLTLPAAPPPAAAAAAADAAPRAVARLHLDRPRQTIEGFGTCYIDWADDRRPEYDDPAFYDTIVHDLGLSLVRQQMADEMEPSNDDADAAHLHWPGFHTGDIGAGWSFADRMRFLEEFQRRGVDRFVLTPWTPPSWAKTNRASRFGGHLRMDRVEEYAEYMAAHVMLARVNHGLNIGYVTVQNELLFIEPYTSCVYTPQVLREAVRALQRRFDAEGITTGILLPEEMMDAGRMLAYVAPTLRDPETRRYRGGFASHRQGGADALAAWRDATRHHGRADWMTETSGHEQTWAGALEMAVHMHEHLAGADFAAWIYWQITDSPSSGVYTLLVDGQKTPKYHAAKHFYRYVRPGAVRVEAPLSGSGELLLSAYRHDVEGTLTVVAINPGDTPVALTLEVPAEPDRVPRSWARFVSTADQGCAPDGDVSGPTTVPPRGIVTLVGRAPGLRVRDRIAAWPVAWERPAGSPPAPWGTPTPPAPARQAPHRSFSPLHVAATAGRIDELRRLLAAGADVDAVNHTGWTVLHAAAAANGASGEIDGRPGSKLDVLRLVLAAGPRVAVADEEGWTPLHAAATNAHAAWQQRAEDNPDRIALLAAAGVPVDAADDHGRTALHWAAWQGYDVFSVRPDIVEALLRAGADPHRTDARGRTALHYAAEMGFAPICEALVAAGARTDVADARGDTPAALRARREAADAEGDRLNDLLRAAAGAHPASTPPAPVVALRTGTGRHGPELLRAAWRGDLDRVRDLLADDADVWWRDSDGFRAVDRARDNGHREIVRLLRDREARP